jgi:uncharacterized protein
LLLHDSAIQTGRRAFCSHARQLVKNAVNFCVYLPMIDDLVLIRSVPAGRQGCRSAILLLALIAWLAMAERAWTQEKSLLWEASREGSSVHLLGSIHYLRQEHYPLHRAILKALDGSRRLVLEIDLNNTSTETAQKVTIEKAVYRDGSTLAKNVSAETLELASKRANELGLDMRILDPMKPWFAALTMVAIQLQRMGLDPNLGVDRHLAARAKSSGKPTAGLETLESQLGTFDRLSGRDQELMLRETVGALERLEKSISEIVATWLMGDADALSGLLLAGKRDYPDLYERVVVERNRRWVAEIEKFIAQGGGELVVVGAAHVVGKDSVIEMLKSKGYRVEQR